MMIPIQLEVLPNQEKKLHTALKKEKGCKLKCKKVPKGAHTMLMRKKYAKRLQMTPNGNQITLPFSHKDLVQNLHHKGGFLPLIPLIAAALAPVIGGVAGGLIEKEIAGSGFRSNGRPWWHGGKIGQKKQMLYSMEKCGTGLYLAPWKGAGFA